MSDPHERERRLAEALRINLRRRKAQTRARVDAPVDEGQSEARAAPADQGSGAA